MLRFCLCLIVFIFAPFELFAQNGTQSARTFSLPQIKNFRLDYCKHWGTQCGKPAADLFCTQRGFAKSTQFQPDFNVGRRGTQTLVFGDGRLCSGPQCSSFRSITCANNTPKLQKPVIIPLPEQDKPIKILPKIKAKQVQKLLPDGASLFHCTSGCEFKLDHPIELSKQRRDEILYWDTTAIKEATAIIWQISDGPFPSFNGGTKTDFDFDQLVFSEVRRNASGSFKLRHNELEQWVKNHQAGGPTRLRKSQNPNYYVRVLPLSGGRNGRIVGQPSRSIGIYLNTQPPQQEPFQLHIPLDGSGADKLFDLQIVKFDPPQFFDPNRWGCVIIKGYRPGATDTVKSVFKIGRELCPRIFRGDGDGSVHSFGEFVEWSADKITGTWDWAADRFDDLKSIAVDVVLDYTIYGLQCRAGAMVANELVGEDAGNKANAICRQGAEIAIDSGLVYMGIPPNLPRYNELVDRGVEYGVELAAEEFESQTGVPCVAWCEDALRAGLNHFAEKIKRQQGQPGCVGKKEANARGREPLCIPNTVISVPAPGAVEQPPLLRVRVTRNRKVAHPLRADHPSCYLSSTMRVSNTFPGGRVSINYGTNSSIFADQVPAQDIEEVLYTAAQIQLPLDLAPGQSIEVPVLFDNRRRFLLPWTKRLDIKARSQLALPNFYYHRDWFQVYSGGAARLIASSDCSLKNSVQTYGLPFVN